MEGRWGGEKGRAVGREKRGGSEQRAVLDHLQRASFPVEALDSSVERGRGKEECMRGEGKMET